MLWRVAGKSIDLIGAYQPLANLTFGPSVKIVQSEIVVFQELDQIFAHEH
jgi:hypothetical protein